MAYTKYTEDDHEAISERLWERKHMTCGESPAQAWQRMHDLFVDGARREGECFGNVCLS